VRRFEGYGKYLGKKGEVSQVGSGAWRIAAVVTTPTAGFEFRRVECMEAETTGPDRLSDHEGR